jgi:four helix bundle protein
MALARRAYALSEELPKSEAYGLLSQMRRAAVSIPSNIAEGHGRLTDSQFRHFLGNARGSLYEMQTQLELAGSLGYLDGKLVRELMDQGWEVARLINGLISSMTQGKKAGNQAAMIVAPATCADTANSASSLTGSRSSIEFALSHISKSRCGAPHGGTYSSCQKPSSAQKGIYR